MAIWTTEQQKAIDDSGNSLLVAAAAGSGKTAVLVERIIQKISNPENKVNIDQLLVVTFTNAAAMEMKERIGEAIYKQLKENPGSEHLYNQSILLNKANITTLHSFCLDLVREHFYLLNLDPNFKIADETEAMLLKQEALEEVFEEYYLSEFESESFIYLVDCYGGKEDLNLQNLILKMLDISSSHPEQERWIGQVSNKLTEIDWFAPVLIEAKKSIDSARAKLEEAINLSQLEEGLQPYLTVLNEEIGLFDDLLLATKGEWNDLVILFEENTTPFKRLPNAKKGKYSEIVKEQVKACREYAKHVFDSLHERYFNRKREELEHELAELKAPLQFLSTLAWQVHQKYMEKKQQKNLVDFSDMEHFCLELLQQKDSNTTSSPSELSKNLKAKFIEVLVDEYQDINNVQEKILTLISHEQNLFMVGDVKQSIYSFRMANPQLFIEKYNHYPKEIMSGKLKIDLNQNFRCRKNVVDGVNYIFNNLMLEQHGGISYDEDAMLRFSAHYPENDNVNISSNEGIDVFLLDRNQLKSNENLDEEEGGTLALEGKIIAKEIVNLINKQALIWDKEIKQYRPVTYRDMVVLLRSPKSKGEELIEELLRANIPACGENGEGYFSAWEVRMMLALLKVLDNPQQDIPLVAVMRSPYFQFSSDELSEIRIGYPEHSFYQAVMNYKNEEGVLADKISTFWIQINKWRTLARRTDLSKLLWTLYRETNFYNYVGSLTFGNQRQANLRALHDRARQYEETSFKGLFMFLRFINNLEENGKDLEPAKILNDSENVVRIMSIHKSKGLEFPVVFLANMGKKFNLQDSYKDIILHRDLGFGPYYVNQEKQIKYPTIANQVIKQRMREELLAEEIRILYVALTRAREKLVLVGTVNDIEKSFTNWRQLQIESSNNYLDWIMPILAKHPDNIELCKTPYDSICIHQDSSHWNMKFVTELTPDKDGVSYEQRGSNEPIYEETIDLDWKVFVDNCLGWKYPLKNFTDKKSKVTVTEIKNKFTTEYIEEPKKYGFSKRPNFLQQQNQLTAAERGTAIHLMMSKVKLQQKIDLDYLTEFSNQLVIDELLTASQRESIDLLQIKYFFDSDLGKRLIKYQKSSYRELPFSFGIDSNIVYPELKKGAKNILVQGMIDCLWKEEDGWVLVDYKSDYVSNDNYKKLIQDYTGQVNLYALAIEQIWKEKIKEKYIYLFSINKAIKI